VKPQSADQFTCVPRTGPRYHLKGKSIAGCRKFPTNPPLRGLSRLPRRIDEFRGKRRAGMHGCRSTTRPSQVSAKEVASDAKKKDLEKLEKLLG
jgi:hypothetical protein